MPAETIEASRLGDHSCHLHDGRVTLAGDPLSDLPASPLTAGLVAP